MRGCARCSRDSAPSTIRRWPCSACRPRTRTTRSGPCGRRSRSASSAWRHAPGSRPARRSCPAAPPPERSRPPPSGCSGRPRAARRWPTRRRSTPPAARSTSSLSRRLAARAAAPRRPAPRPLVGRAYELAALESLYARVVAERRPHLVTVVGHAGIGKSRLVDEFGADHRGRCLPYGEGITYWALREILARAAQIMLGDSAADAAAKLRALSRRWSATRSSASRPRWPPAPGSCWGPEREEPSPERWRRRSGWPGRGC